MNGTFRSTSSHNETPTVHLSSSMAGGNVIFNGAESAHVSGKLISAHDLIDLTPVTFFGPSVNEMKSGRLVESSTGIGYSSRTLDSGQEVVVPTVIMLSGKFKSIPAPDKKSGSKLTLQAVELSAPGGTEILKEHLAEESYEAKTW
ncbi:MAG: hypothetical protein Q8S21_00050, partial [Candidatus Paracaedibacteraceae bacterium]|nr:hypothetical protein [Candidatus Paracaedibacteraceae bacterium]